MQRDDLRGGHVSQTCQCHVTVDVFTQRHNKKKEPFFIFIFIMAGLAKVVSTKKKDDVDSDDSDDNVPPIPQVSIAQGTAEEVQVVTAASDALHQSRRRRKL